MAEISSWCLAGRSASPPCHSLSGSFRTALPEPALGCDSSFGRSCRCWWCLVKTGPAAARAEMAPCWSNERGHTIISLFMCGISGDLLWNFSFRNTSFFYSGEPKKLICRLSRWKKWSKAGCSTQSGQQEATAWFSKCDIPGEPRSGGVCVASIHPSFPIFSFRGLLKALPSFPCGVCTLGCALPFIRSSARSV